MDDIKKIGLLSIGDSDALGDLKLRLVNYYEADIGVIYEYVFSFDINSNTRIIREIPIRFPSL